MATAKVLDTTKRSVVGRLRRVLAYFVLAVLLGYGASNLWLCSGWGTGMAEDKLKGRTGFDWEIDSMTWSPWNGLTVNDARMLQPEELRTTMDQPLLSVERIRVQPYWTQLLRGRARAREIQVDAPEVMVTVEMLTSMASRMPHSGVVSSPSPGPVRPPAPGARNPVPAPVTPGGTVPGGDRKVPQPSKGAPAPPAEPKVKPRPSAGLPTRVRVTGAKVDVVSVSKGLKLFHADSISVDLPVFGEDAGGMIKVGAIEIPGVPRITDLEQNLVWKRPYLEVEKQTVEIGGVEVQFLSQVGMGKNALGQYPFLFDCVIPAQSLKSAQWFERLALEVSADKLTGRLRVNGSLLKPMTWRADMLLAGVDVRVKEKHGSHDVGFDAVYLPAVFRQGQLRWNSARMIGEDISILGNGQIAVGGGVLFVTRFVTSPEVAAMLTRGLNGSKVVTIGAKWWRDLDTPDRKVRDLLVSGSLADPVIDAGSKNSSLSVWQLVSATLDFVRDEMKEEGKELPPLPNGKMLQTKNNENH